MAGGFDLLGLGGGLGSEHSTAVVAPIFGTNALLSPRQFLSFNHRVDLYRPTRTAATDGRMGVETWGPIAAYVNVHCHVESKVNLSELREFGRLQTGGLLTLDLIHFAELQEVDDNWLVYNRSLRPDGSRTSMFGIWWMIRSISRSFTQSERRQGGKKVFEASLERVVPKGLVVGVYS